MKAGKLGSFHLYRFRPITFVPGFLKIFDEILVNASDNKVNTVCVIKSDGNSSTPIDQRPYHGLYQGRYRP